MATKNELFYGYIANVLAEKTTEKTVSTKGLENGKN